MNKTNPRLCFMLFSEPVLDVGTDGKGEGVIYNPPRGISFPIGDKLSDSEPSKSGVMGMRSHKTKVR